MENEEEGVYKEPPNQEVKSQTQCGRLNNEEMDTLWQSGLNSGMSALRQDSTDTSGTRRMEDYAIGLSSIISTGTNW